VQEKSLDYRNKKVLLQCTFSVYFNMCLKDVILLNNAFCEVEHQQTGACEGRRVG